MRTPSFVHSADLITLDTKNPRFNLSFNLSNCILIRLGSRSIILPNFAPPSLHMSWSPQLYGLRYWLFA